MLQNLTGCCATLTYLIIDCHKGRNSSVTAMARVVFVFWCSAIAAHAAASQGATLLALPMFGGNSPSMDVMAVAGELQQRGYHLVTAPADIDVPFMHKALARHQSPHPPSVIPTSIHTPGKLQFITFKSPKGSFKQLLAKELSAAGNTGLSVRKIAPILLKMLAEPCQWLLTNATAMQAIRAAAPDLILTFELPFGSDSCGCLVSHTLGVPYVVVDGNPLVRHTPFKYPQFGSDLTQADLRTPLGFLKNTAVYVFSRMLFTLLPLVVPHWRHARAAAGLSSPGSLGGCHPAVTLHMKTFDLEWPRALPPNHLLVGPGTPRLPNPPQQQQADHPTNWAFLEGADPAAGVVLVGFGSTGVFGLSMVSDDYIHLAEAFSDLAPTRVLWALLPSNLPQGLTLADLPLGPNVLVVPWVDYNDVLGHPATRLFISHCGIHSMWEAAFHGVPVIGVPFQREQKENAAKLVSRGMGEMNQESVAFRSAKHRLVYQRQTMRELALKVLSTPSYHQTAARISGKLQAHASFRTPIQRAADEVEVLLAGSSPRSSSGNPQLSLASREVGE